jgi:hypothetical protein
MGTRLFMATAGAAAAIWVTVHALAALVRFVAWLS